MQKKLMTIAEAIEKVHGKTPRPQPSTLGDALAIVRQIKVAPIPSPHHAPPAGRTLGGDGLPGLRAFLEERRRGRP